MPSFDFPTLACVQVALIAISCYWLIKRNDELPLVISTFTFYISSYRYWAVTNNEGQWVDITNFGFAPITNEGALSALGYIVFGELFLLVTYMSQQKNNLSIVSSVTDSSFLKWLRPKVLFLGLLCFPLVIIARGRVAAAVGSGSSLAFGVSNYLYLFPMLLVGVATLLFCLWKFGGLRSANHKLLALVLLAGVAYLTYSPSARFQFLAWIIAGGIITSSSYRPGKRLVIFACTGVIAIAFFAFAGALRNPELADDALKEAAVERAFSASDANMLDGFVLMQEVYPKRLDFTLGMEHLEILMRPIPRSVWPGKPVGGYMNKLGLTTNDGQGTLGISQSLFGSFYGEGGVAGIAIFSFIYGSILAKIVHHSTTRQPFASIMIRAILCACMIPLLRGGDLPGIYAWFGMAFWPCFLLLWVKRKYFRLRSSLGNFYQFNQTSPLKLPD